MQTDAEALARVLASDTFLACLALLPLSLLFLKLRPHIAWHDLLALALGRARALRHDALVTGASGPFSLPTAAAAFMRFGDLSALDMAAMRARNATLGRAHARIARDLGYPAKLERLADAARANALLAGEQGIGGLGAKEFGLDVSALRATRTPAVAGSLYRTREVMRHFVRDWSKEGEEERSTIFGPILEVLDAMERKEREGMKVLVPGSGLGRLAWEISELGYDTTANELSFFMNLALRFLISPETTHTINQHLVYPYAHWFSHQRTNDALFRSVPFPDALPRRSPHFNLCERDFLTLTPPGPGYDFVVTLFFIDTSCNLIATLEHIHRLLRPGGRWINLGPLLWPGGAEAALEFSLEEVIQLARTVGFVFDEPETGGRKAGEGSLPTRTVECEYTADREAMMRWMYKAEFWVATRLADVLL